MASNTLQSVNISPVLGMSPTLETSSQLDLLKMRGSAWCNRPLAASTAATRGEVEKCSTSHRAYRAARASLNVALLVRTRRVGVLTGHPRRYRPGANSRHNRIQTQQRRRAPLGRQPRPLSLRLKAQMGTAFLDCRLDAAALHVRDTMSAAGRPGTSRRRPAAAGRCRKVRGRGHCQPRCKRDHAWHPERRSDSRHRNSPSESCSTPPTLLVNVFL